MKSPRKLPNKIVEKIPIDIGGKTLLFLKGVPHEIIEGFVPAYEEWLKKPDPVFFITITPDVEIQLIKVHRKPKHKEVQDGSEESYQDSEQHTITE